MPASTLKATPAGPPAHDRPRPWIVRSFLEFAALGGDASYLWPRWIVLRGVGAIYIVIFAGIIAEGAALIGPHGITPIPEYFRLLAASYPRAIDGFFHAPGLFWISSSPGMVATLEWGGLAAAIALTLNVWPRMALAICWLFFLSFVTTGRFFSSTQPDQMMVEAALLCIPFAPAGFFPGLGTRSPPRPIAVFMMRWLLFRLMLEAGLAKLFSGDLHWRNLTALDVMYETTPFPTILGYFDHQLPHAYHVFEVALTFVAELVAPLLAVVGGRRGRWFAFAAWVVFQGGIELTNNFGWLNLAAITLGLLLLDDQMIAAAANRFGIRVAAPNAASAGPPAKAAGWGCYGLRCALGLQFALTWFFYAIAAGLPTAAIPKFIGGPAAYLFGNLHSANAYPLFVGLPPVRYELEFEGSNDDGVTWLPYEFRYQPQQIDHAGSFIAPWYPRFEANLQITLVSTPNSPLFPAVASHLLARDNPAVLRLFRNDPFPDPAHPPKMIRMAVYQLSFLDWKTHRKTGNYWRKEYLGDYLPMMLVDAQGHITEAK